MTRPRKEQIRSVNTGYTAGRIDGVPGSSEVVLSPSALNAFAVTDVPGGAEQDVQGYVTGTVLSPFPVLAGDTFTVALDGGPPSTVALASSDTTASRVAAKINAACSANVASNSLGRLVIQSLTVGASSSVRLVEVTPGVLTKFGMAAGTYSGLDGPSRGVLTRTPDLLGGHVQLATVDGRHLVTDAYEARAMDSIGATRRIAASIPGGIPIHGRLTFDGTDYRIRFHASFPSRASVVTFNSNFATLAGSDSLTLNPNYGFTVTFPSPPYTRDQVVGRINQAYATAAGFADGKAIAEGSTSGPFALGGYDAFSLSVDGAPPVIINFTGAETSATQVADRINTVVGITVATVVGGSRIRLTSPTPDGHLSSLRIWDSSAFFSDGCLSSLGIQPGYYRGPFVAEAYGPDEIRISSFARGSSATLVVGGSGTTLTRMGLVAGTYSGTNEPREEPVPLPFQTVDEVAPPPVNYPVDMIFPEVMDFGDVDPRAESRVQEFLARSAGSNQALLGINPFYLAVTRPTYDPQSRGLFDIGKPVVVGPDGTIPRGLIQTAFDYSDSLFKQFLRYPGGVVSAIVARRVETTGYDGNPLPPFPDMEFFADPGNVAGSSPSRFRFFLGVPTNASPSAFEIVKQNTSPTFGATVPGYVSVGAGMAVWQGSSVVGPLSTKDSLLLASAGTVAMGGTGRGYVPLTASPTDRDGIPRLAEGSVNSSATGTAGKEYSIMRSLNARHEITVGDGVSSWGDFSGSDAIQQARAFLAASQAWDGVAAAVIRVKPGLYNIDATVDFSFMKDLSIEGYYPSGYGTPQTVYINSTVVGSAIRCAYFNMALKNVLCVDGSSGTAGPRWLDSATPSGCAHIVIEDCSFYGGSMRLTDFKTLDVRRILYRGDLNPVALGSADLRTIFLQSSTGTGGIQYIDRIVFEDCVLYGSPNASIVYFQQFYPSSSGINSVRNFSFSRCLCYTAVSSVVSPAGASDPAPVTGFAAGATGAGLLSFDPNSNAFAGGSGLVIERLSITDTDIIAGTYGSGNGAIALNVVPSGWLGSAGWTFGSTATAVHDVTIRNVYVEDAGPAVNECSLFSVGGVGQSSTTMAPSQVRGRLTVENLRVNVQGKTHGRSLMNMMPWFTKPDYPGTDAIRRGGAVCLSGWDMDIRGVRLIKSAASCRSPEIFLCPYQRMKLDGYESRPQTGGSTLAPSGRMVVRNPYNPTWEIRNVVIANELDVANWSNDGVIVVEPGHNFGFPSSIEVEAPNAYARKSIRNFYICLLGTFGVGSASAGVRMECSAVVGYPFSTITSPDPSQPVKNGGIVIEDGYIGAGDTPQQGPFYGILGDINGMATSGTEIDNVTVRNVHVDSTIANGIHIDAGHLQYPVVLENNFVHNCGVGLAYAGITVLSYIRSDPLRGFVKVTGNQVALNNSLAIGVQINVRDINTSLSGLCRAMFYQNSCESTGGSGAINVTRTATSPLSTNTLIGLQSVRGVETGYAGSSTAGVVQSIGVLMMHNLAALSSTNSGVQ